MSCNLSSERMAASASLCTNDGPSEVSDALLPPLPQPERAQLRQSLGGCSLVLGIIVLFVAITLASALAAPMSQYEPFGQTENPALILAPSHMQPCASCVPD